MRKIWILGLALMMILAACAPATQMEEKAPVMEEKAPVVEVKAPAEAPTVGVKPPVRPLPSERQDTAPEPVTTAPKTEMNPQLRDLLKRADEKISSLQYLYGGTETKNLFLDTYFVKGTQMKIKTYEEDYYVRDGYYDTIYVDLGIGCCEENSRCKSHNVDNMGKKFDVDVASMNIPKTPYQWAKEIPGDAQLVGPQTVNDRSVTYIKFAKDNKQYEMWVDDTYGVPHKIVATDSAENAVKYQFNDMQFNGLKDADFNAPCD